jgi:hypothetical protein
MKNRSLLGFVGGSLAAGAALAFLYGKFLRPWHLRWGATDEEITEPLPGDSVKTDADVQVTHAITINAPATDVWKWLVQIGQGRGGFYSYDWIENTFGLGVKTAEEIVPAFQELKAGDFIRSAHKGWLGGRFDDVAGWFVVELVRERSLVLRDEIERGSWAFVLRPISENETRLMVRVRGKAPQAFGMKIFNYGFFEPAHFIMERKMLLTLKDRAENGPISDSRRVYLEQHPAT